MPHGHCYLWQPHILWTNVISDLLIAIAYFSIPVAILIFIKKRPDVGHRNIALLFSLFILFCGVTHVFGVITIWTGIYGYHGIIKSLTALVSITTAVYLYKMLPELVLVPTSKVYDGLKQKLSSIAKKEQHLDFKVEQQKLVQFMLDAMPVSGCLLDSQLSFELVNQKFMEELNYDSQTKSLTQLLAPNNEANYQFLGRIKDYLNRLEQGKIPATDEIKEVIYLKSSEQQIFPADVKLTSKLFEKKRHFILTFNNLTEIHQVKRDLDVSIRRYERTVSATLDGVWDINFQTHEITWSENVYQLLNINRAVTPSLRLWREHIHPEYISFVMLSLQSALRNRKDFVIEYLGHDKPDSFGWFQLSGHVYQATNNMKLAISGQLRYIDNNKSLEQSISEKSELLQTIYQGAHQAIWVVNVEQEDFRFMVFNQAACDWLGVKQSEIVGKSLSELKENPLPNEAVLSFKQNYQTCVDNRDIVDYSENVHINGKIGWYKTTLYPIKNHHGDVTKLVGTSVDISPLKLVQKQLSEQQQLLENIIDASVCGVYLFNISEGRVQKINQRFTDITGYNSEDIRQLKSLNSLYHIEDLPQVKEHLGKVLDSSPGELFNIQYRIKGKTQSWIYCQSVTTLLKLDKNGQPSLLLTTFNDVTKQVQLLGQLEESNSYLERFAMVASHDLQEPLRKIIAFSGLLSDSLANNYDLDEESRYQFDRITDAAQRMRIMIRDIMRLSQINSLSLQRTIFSLKDAVNQACEQLQLVISDTQATVHLEQNDVVLFADKSLVSLLLQNLIANAIKFRNKVPPKINISAQNNESSTILKVSDNGIGIEPMHIRQIFEPFRRLNTHDKYDGSGIGLALCNQICKAHDGDIHCESEINKGSSFVVTLPK
jgi:PAS domain S-box-containing protein